MDKILDETLANLKEKHGVRGLVVFMDDDGDFYISSSATSKKDAIRFLARLVLNEAQRQGISPQVVAKALGDFNYENISSAAQNNL